MKILAFINLNEWNSLKDQPAKELPLARRVLDVARSLNADVHFSHLVHDTALITGSSEDRELILLREQVQSIEQKWLDVLVDSASDLKVTAKTSFASVSANALANEIKEHNPDLVFKIARDHNFVLGLFSNLDWELIRQSPVPTWFVKQEMRDIKRVVVAVDFVDEDIDEKVSAKGSTKNSLDYEVLGKATEICKALNAQLTVVHAYPAAETLVPAMGFTGAGAGLGSPETAKLLLEAQQKQEQATKKHHEKAIGKLCSGFNLKHEDIVIMRGHPNDVITAVCKEQNADLIVMGATNIGRWERMISPVHAEPALADADADVLFVPETRTQ
jgi:nucleotide-binding universal stress UspA family protein